MPNYYYILRVVDCRQKSDPSPNPIRREAENNLTENPKGTWEFRHTAANAANAAAGTSSLVAAVIANISKAPGMVKYLDLNPFLAALSSSASTTNDGIPGVGAWSERVGKRFLGYEIGVSTASYGNAELQVMRHDMGSF